MKRLMSLLLMLIMLFSTACAQDMQSVLQEMLSRGLISAREYATIDAMLLAKYGISSNSIFRDIDLLCEEVRVNMSHHKGVT